jgi:hypothetical protein
MDAGDEGPYLGLDRAGIGIPAARPAVIMQIAIDVLGGKTCTSTTELR